MVESKAAKRYARALFLFAEEQNELDAVFEDIKSLLDWLEANPELEGLFSHPRISEENRRKVIEEVLGGHLTPISLKFLVFLNSKKRLAILHPVLRTFIAQVNEAKGISKAVVYSAVALTQEGQKEIKARLTQRLGGKVEISNEVQPDLIGGFRIRVGNEILDASVASQLKRLKQTIINA